ncbi:MAG: ATP-dependent Clp protease adaptor ClpS [Treponema sp.]|nr:ATP-dependent Clp protease adaptor ClpS [Treponema sp.]
MKPKIREKPASKSNAKYKEPEQFKVILLNDHYTTMDFVVEVLVVIFHKSVEEANKIMLDVHNKGKGIVGVFTWDIAVTKTEQVHAAAEATGYPLKCIVEPA